MSNKGHGYDKNICLSSCVDLCRFHSDYKQSGETKPKLFVGVASGPLRVLFRIIRFINEYPCKKVNFKRYLLNL